MRKLFKNCLVYILIICFITSLNGMNALAADYEDNTISEETNSNNEIIITKDMTEEEINAIIQANPGFLVNPLADAREVVYLP